MKERVGLDYSAECDLWVVYWINGPTIDVLTDEDEARALVAELRLRDPERTRGDQARREHLEADLYARAARGPDRPFPGIRS